MREYYFHFFVEILWRQYERKENNPGRVSFVRASLKEGDDRFTSDVFLEILSEIRHLPTALQILLTNTHIYRSVKRWGIPRPDQLLASNLTLAMICSA